MSDRRDPNHFLSGDSSADKGQIIRLVDLMALSEYKALQDHFSDVGGVTVRTVDTRGEEIIPMSNPPALCSELLHNKTFQDKCCYRCLPNFLGGQGMLDEDFTFECFAGLKSYVLPLKVSLSKTDSLLAGYMLIGPFVFLQRPDKESFRQTAKEFAVDLEKMWGFILEMRVFSYKALRAFVDMIDGVVGRLFTVSYHKHVLAREVREISGRFQGYVEAHYERQERFLKSFLDVVVEMTKATSASVMLVDSQQKSLTVKASRGLRQSAPGIGSVKIGEGVAGLAAQAHKSFLINAGVDEPLLAGRLHRPELVSSMVVPIACNDVVMGVINAGVQKSASVRFDQASLQALSKMADLAGLALSPAERLGAS